MVVLAILLALVLRSLVAPLYLVASVGLSYLASLGLAVALFVIVGGQLASTSPCPFSCSCSSWPSARTTTSCS